MCEGIILRGYEPAYSDRSLLAFDMCPQDRLLVGSCLLSSVRQTACMCVSAHIACVCADLNQHDISLNP